MVLELLCRPLWCVNFKCILFILYLFLTLLARVYLHYVNGIVVFVYCCWYGMLQIESAGPAYSYTVTCEHAHNSDTDTATHMHMH